MSRSNEQSKNWCFTLNNPVISEADLITQFTSYDSFKYVIFQLEKGENDTPHYQGYVEFTTNHRLSAVRGYLPTAHWEKRKSRTNVAAIEYCQKSESRVDGHEPHTAGEATPNKPGTRPKIGSFLETCATGGLIAAALEDPDTFVRYSHGIQKFLTLQVTQRGKFDSPPVITLMYGPPGCGKTSHYYATHGNQAFSLPCTSGFWFDGYTGQPTCILDDFDGRHSAWSLAQTLRVFDRYRMQAPIKGSFTTWGPDRLYCSTNIHPHLWYDYSGRADQYNALVRRITYVMWWCYLPGTNGESPRPSFVLKTINNPMRVHQDYERNVAAIAEGMDVQPLPRPVINIFDENDPIKINDALWHKFFFNHPQFRDDNGQTIVGVDPYDF